MARIDFWHNKLPGMGSRKMVVKLREDGFWVGRKQVRRYMAEMNIRAAYPKPNLSKRNHRDSILTYLLRNTTISYPNQVWSIDTTFIKMHRSHMYLTAIIDCFSRKIVGWNLSDTLATSPVLATVREAVNNYGIPDILNSDSVQRPRDPAV